jgi:hypothetical protein
MSIVLVLSSLTDAISGQDDVFALGYFVALHEFRAFDRPRIRIRGDHLDAVVGRRIDQVKVDIAAWVRRGVQWSAVGRQRLPAMRERFLATSESGRAKALRSSHGTGPTSAES